jgi:cytochrome c biogenesis protein CcmG/thiol:disulfide interchange protein DsbE
MFRLAFTKAIAAIALLILCLALPQPIGAEIAAPSSRKEAPAFSLENSKGEIINLSDYKGKVVLLNFWATWCHGCKQEIPWYMEFATKYGQRGLAVIGVSMDEDGWKSVRPYITEKKLNYAIVIGSEALANQYGGVDSMPVSILIDRHGKIADSHSGVVDKNSWKEEIRKLLDESK